MKRRSGSKRKIRGFTLVELMVAVAVLAILTAIAYPMYQDQVRKSRRATTRCSGWTMLSPRRTSAPRPARPRKRSRSKSPSR